MNGCDAGEPSSGVPPHLKTRTTPHACKTNMRGIEIILTSHFLDTIRYSKKLQAFK